MYLSLYTPEPTLTDHPGGIGTAISMATVENQDFAAPEGIQRGFYSGAQDGIIFGRNEPALQH